MRGKKAQHKKLDPDPRYGSLLVSRFINHVMQGGKKSVAQRVVYRALDIVDDKADEDALTVFEQAVGNLEPRLEVVSRRVGGATYQVPRQVRGERRQYLAMTWMIGIARGSGTQSMAQRLAKEILDAANNEGAAIKKKENVHRMAEANKAFAHLAW